MKLTITMHCNDDFTKLTLSYNYKPNYNYALDLLLYNILLLPSHPFIYRFFSHA